MLHIPDVFIIKKQDNLKLLNKYFINLFHVSEKG